MQFEWDPSKAEKVLRQRNIDFENVALLFNMDHITIRSDQNDEERWLIIGIVDGAYVTGVFTLRYGTIRLITARRARKNERELYSSRYLGGT